MRQEREKNEIYLMRNAYINIILTVISMVPISLNTGKIILLQTILFFCSLIWAGSLKEGIDRWVPQDGVMVKKLVKQNIFNI